MSQAEKTELGATLDEVKIWRGCGTPNGARGLSWTSDKKRAESHAAGTEPLVVSAVCRKSDVLAYFTERQESENRVKSRLPSFGNDSEKRATALRTAWIANRLGTKEK
jgi:hypothetical protein